MIRPLTHRDRDCDSALRVKLQMSITHWPGFHPLSPGPRAGDKNKDINVSAQHYDCALHGWLTTLNGHKAGGTVFNTYDFGSLIYMFLPDKNLEQIGEDF